MGECPECGGSLGLESAEVGEIVQCPDCGVELEVVQALELVVEAEASGANAGPCLISRSSSSQ